MDYDANLPKYYNQNHQFLWEKMDKTLLNDSKLFEKIEIRWFSIGDMKRHKKWFRPFYREMVNVFLSKQEEIKDFIETKSKKMHRKTSKNRD
jgi:hypothetical protein